VWFDSLLTVIVVVAGSVFVMVMLVVMAAVVLVTAVVAAGLTVVLILVGVVLVVLLIAFLAAALVAVVAVVIVVTWFGEVATSRVEKTNDERSQMSNQVVELWSDGLKARDLVQSLNDSLNETSTSTLLHGARNSFLDEAVNIRADLLPLGLRHISVVDKEQVGVLGVGLGQVLLEHLKAGHGHVAFWNEGNITGISFRFIGNGIGDLVGNFSWVEAVLTSRAALGLLANGVHSEDHGLLNERTSDLANC